ncbi:Hypothetical predicted protein [Mytilus galloprovincialis]|uniref:Uncharacterized protein n=1 Tax=Mytilus galloprovincialis TaxID=29158 RepID=A0A8B6CLF6_MYTGA|nr:Hypothetical predicted protein [Mytilus galloprovincialis]
MELSMTKYFNAVADNKRIDAGLKVYEHRIDDSRRKAINRIWKTKFELLDELVLLNVKTPECHGKRPGTGEIRVGLKNMTLDDKLFSSKPVSFGCKKSKTPVAPVIEVNGKEAVCYPNPEARRGRHVLLDKKTSRRIESAKVHTTALYNIDRDRIQREKTQNDLRRRNPRNFCRPFTAPRSQKPGIPQSKRLLNRPKTSVGFHSISVDMLKR